MESSTSVLIVDGSLNGLTLAMLDGRDLRSGSTRTDSSCRRRALRRRRALQHGDGELHADAWGSPRPDARSIDAGGNRRSRAIPHRTAGDLEDTLNRLSTAYGIESDDAVLIRPDGFIAWRHAGSADGVRALDNALERLCVRAAVNTGGRTE